MSHKKLGYLLGQRIKIPGSWESEAPTFLGHLKLHVPALEEAKRPWIGWDRRGREATVKATQVLG